MTVAVLVAGGFPGWCGSPLGQIGVATNGEGGLRQRLTGRSAWRLSFAEREDLALGRLGWSLRRIEQALAVRRETVSGNLEAGGHRRARSRPADTKPLGPGYDRKA
jgi:hypothetical protein